MDAVEDNRKLLTEYLDKHVKGYLIGDLQRMIDLPFEGRPYGELGYTCLLVLCTGMELLGSLLVKDREEKAFNAFWEYLSADPRYTESVRNVFYKAVRHKLAHMFTLTVGVKVDRKIIPHLIQNDGIIGINCEELFNDFVNAYERIRKVLLEDSAELGNRIDFLNNQIGDPKNLEKMRLLKSSSDIPIQYDIHPNMTSASGPEFLTQGASGNNYIDMSKVTVIPKDPHPPDPYEYQ